MGSQRVGHDWATKHSTGSVRVCACYCQAGQRPAKRPVRAWHHFPLTSKKLSGQAVLLDLEKYVISSLFSRQGSASSLECPVDTLELLSSGNELPLLTLGGVGIYLQLHIHLLTDT